MPTTDRLLPARPATPARSSGSSARPSVPPAVDRSLLARGWAGLVVAAVAALGILTTYLLAPLNPNIRYELGVKAVSTYSAAETFSHRPLAYRLLMDGIGSLAEVGSSGITAYEVTVRLIGLGLAAGATILLWRGLRRRGVAAPGLHAVVAGGAVVAVGTQSSIEADWMAPVFTMAGIGVAVLGRRRWSWPMAVLAGALFVAAAAMKIVSLPVALVGLLVVGVLSRRQFLRSAAGALAIGILYVGATLVWVPWEITWLNDIRTLQPPLATSLSEGPTFFVESAVRWPVLALLPAALVLAGRGERLFVLVAVVLTATPIVYQGQYFAYHAAPLCVVAAVALFRALRGRVTGPVGLGILVLVVAATALTAASADWRDTNRVEVTAVAVAVGLLGVAWALQARRRRPARRPLALAGAALATLAMMYPVMSPFDAGLLRLSAAKRPTPVSAPGTTQPAAGAVSQIHQRIGADTMVTYLTFGDSPYFLGNPTSCRYPSPLFLQRTRYTTRHLATRSYAENLACLDDPASQWLIIDRNWFRLSAAPPEVRAKVAAGWRCSAGFDVDGLTICPRG